MTYPAQRKKNSKLRILLAPVVAPIFILGWILSFAGESKNNKKQRPTNKTELRDEDITLSAIPQEELTIAA